MNIASQLRPYQRKEIKLQNSQRTSDIIAAIMTSHRDNKSEYDKISDNFWTGDVRSTCKGLYDYCKKNIRYDIEPDSKQTVRTPGAILAMGSGDCKHYASFINGVLDSLKRKGHPIDSRYRFASYRMFDKEPHHVFVVAKDNGREIWIDPVLKGNSFDSHKQYQHAIDKNASMSGLYSISGVGKRKPKAGGSKPPKKAARKAKHAANKAKRKAARKERPKGRIVAKVALAPARNSFLLLLKGNIFKYASKLKTKMNAEPAFADKLKNKWKGLGGNPAVLMKNIQQGVNLWNRKHPAKKINGLGENYTFNKYGWSDDYIGAYLPGIGVVQFAAAGGILLAAMPIIKKIKDLLGSAGIDTNQSQEEADGEMEKIDKQSDDGGGEYSEPDAGGGDLDENYVESEGIDEQDYEDETGNDGLGRVRKPKKPKVPKTKRPLIRLRPKGVNEAAALINLRKAGTPGVTRTPRNKSKVKIKNKTVIRKVVPLRTKTTTRPNGQRVIDIQDTSYNDAMERDNQRTPPSQDNDNHGVDDVLNQVKETFIKYKTPIIITGVGLLALKIVRSMPSKPKRRR